MEEITLMRICAIISLLGIIILYFQLESQENDFFTFIEGEDNDIIKIRGNIKSLDVRENYAFIDLLPKDTIRIVVFDDIEGYFRENIDVVIEGRISESEDFPKSIIADKIIID